MPTPVESATLNLELFELRRDPVLREARQWWLDDFTPRTFEELAAVAGGERNASGMDGGVERMQMLREQFLARRSQREG